MLNLLCWYDNINIYLLYLGTLKQQVMRARPRQNKHARTAEHGLEKSWLCKRAQCLQEERGVLVVTVLFSSRSRTQTAPLWTQQVECLPCCQSPGRRPPRQPNNAKPADSDKEEGINIVYNNILIVIWYLEFSILVVAVCVYHYYVYFD